jgi:hypothetical protein
VIDAPFRWVVKGAMNANAVTLKPGANTLGNTRLDPELQDLWPERDAAMRQIGPAVCKQLEDTGTLLLSEAAFAAGSMVHLRGVGPNLIRSGKGRLGNVPTRIQVRRIANELERRGYRIVGGGERIPHLTEVYFPPRGGGRRGGASADITAVKNGRRLHINTVDMLPNGQIDPRELRNAARIRRSLQPGEHLILIPKQ